MLIQMEMDHQNIMNENATHPQAPQSSPTSIPVQPVMINVYDFLATTSVEAVDREICVSGGLYVTMRSVDWLAFSAPQHVTMSYIDIGGLASRCKSLGSSLEDPRFTWVGAFVLEEVKKLAREQEGDENLPFKFRLELSLVAFLEEHVCVTTKDSRAVGELSYYEPEGELGESFILRIKEEDGKDRYITLDIEDWLAGNTMVTAQQ